MGKTKIEWTRGDDGSLGSTWNPVRGCSRVSPGCGGPNHEGGCYAEKIAARFSDPGQPFHGFAERTPHGGRWTGKLALVENALDLPLRWRKPRRIFVNSMSDLFHEALPDEAIDKVFAVMALAPQHTFQVLTKRPERMRAYCSTLGRHHDVDRVSLVAKQMNSVTGFHYTLTDGGWALPNVWLGTSVEDAERKTRIDEMRATPAAVRFLSLEPLLGDLGSLDLSGISWVIVGGESGPGARPMHPTWARLLRDQCAAAGVAFFHKQNGAFVGLPEAFDHGITPGHIARAEVATLDGLDMIRVGKKAAGRLLDGRTHDEFPEIRS